MKYLGDYDTSTIIYGKFTTFRPSTGAAYTLAGTPALSVYKDNSTTQSTSGVTLTADFDSVTGLNHFAIDTSSDGTFYAAGSNFDVVITTGTVDSVSVVGSVVASFSLRKTSALKPTTAGRTLDVSSTGEAGVDWANVGSPTTSLALTGTTIASTQKVDVETIKTNPVVNGGTITFPTGATLASTTNITAGTLTTVTNLTNERSKYMHGAVWIDTVNGSAGNTSYTNGIMTAPVNNIANAKEIADNLKLKRFWIQAGSALTLDAGYAGYVFDGMGYTLDLSTRDVSKVQINRVEGLSGVGATCATGEAVIYDSHITNLTIGEADFNRCHLNGTVTLSQVSVPYLFHGCAGVGALGKITFAAANQSAVVAKWSGMLTIAGMAAGRTLYLDGDGDVTFDNTNTGGTVYISGNIRLTNNGTGLSITDTSRFGEDQSIAITTGGISSGSFSVDSINAAALAADAGTELATAVMDLTDAIETGVTPRKALRVALAVLAGKLSGAGTGTETFRNASADSKNRVVATVDGSGNRTALTLDMT